MNCPGPGSGAFASAALVPWYAERPRVLAEEYDLYIDAEVLDLNEPLDSANTLKEATERAQRYLAENPDSGPIVVVHYSHVRVAVAGKDYPQ